MKGPLVSVIVPVYGAQDYIVRCARSLFVQTYPDAEFIFVDDGSPDRSVELLEGLLAAEFPLLKARVRIIRQANAGQARARQAGLDTASGEYVLMVDSDDWIDPDTLEQLVAEAVRTDADIVVYDFWKEYRHWHKLDRERDSSLRDNLLFRRRLYNYKAYGYIVNKFCRRSLCKDMFVPRYNMHEDIVFSTQIIYRARKIVHLRKALYHYDRCVGGSQSRGPSKAERRTRSARNMLDMYEHFRGKEDSPIKGVEDEIILKSAWIAYTMNRALFDERPYLAAEALRFPLACGRFVTLPQQLILRRFLKKLVR